MSPLSLRPIVCVLRFGLRHMAESVAWLELVEKKRYTRADVLTYQLIVQRMVQEKDQNMERVVQNMERVVQEKERVVQEKERVVQEKERVVQQAIAMVNELREKLTKTEKSYEAQLVRSRGLLTGRGVFERAILRAHLERASAAKAKAQAPKFNATATLDQIMKTPAVERTRWARVLCEAAQRCSVKFPDVPEEQILHETWTVFSEDIHMFPWRGKDVKVDPSVPAFARCIIEQVCQEMELSWFYEKGVGDTLEEGDAQEKADPDQAP